MARIFISHSSHNNDQAIRLRDWLSANGWTDIFLDTDPERGLAPGERWQEALKAAADRCEAVLFLISTAWLASRWCLAEFLLARQLGKRIFPLLIEDIPLDSLPVEMTSNHQAVDLVHDALGWERLKEGLRRAGLDPDSFQFPEGRRPYPGFEPLTEDDAAIFFGREAHIVRGLDRLRAMSVAGVERALVVLGASGAGKSSFLRAGLWPRLKRDDRNFLPLPVMRPERGAITGTFGLLAGLENALADPRVSRHPAVRALPRSRGGLGELIARDPSGLSRVFEAIRQASAAALLAASEKPPPTVVISVDQAEELFNEEARTEAEQLMDQLASVLVHDRRLLVILAIRSDSYPRLQAERRLEAIRKEPFDLSPIPAGSLRLLIEGPARVAQPPVKLDPLLVNALLEDASDADSLPLLAFTLGRLYKAYGAGGELTIAAYEALGQISGAVNAAVSEVIARGQEIRALPRNREQLEALLREAFIPHLAKVNRAGHFGRRVAALTEIPARAHPIIDLFVRQHLLVKDRRKVGDSESADVIEVTHEALLREWQALRSWLEADREFLSGKEQLAEDIAAWKAAAPGQKDDALLSGLKLTRARQWLHARAAQDLTESERAYIAASIERADRRLRHSRLAWISAGIILVLCLVAALWQWERAEQSAVQANERLKLARKTSSQLVSLITNDLRTAQGIQTETLQRLLDAAKNSFENLATALKDDATFEAERARMMSGFGEAYVKAGQLTKAEEAFSEALGIYRKLLEREPNNLSLERGIADQLDETGVLFLKQHKYTEARAQFDAALAIRSTIAKRAPTDWITFRDLAKSHYNIGEVQLPMLRPAEALDSQLAARSDSNRALSLTKNASIILDLKRQRSLILVSLATVYEEQNRATERKAVLLESISIRGDLTAANPDNTEDRRLMAWAHQWIGGLEEDSDNYEEALRHHKASLALRTDLVNADPTNNRAKSDLAWSYHNAGNSYRLLKRLPEAEMCLVKAFLLRQQLTRTDDSNHVWRKDYALSLESLGQLARSEGKLLEALEHYQKAREEFEALLQNPQVPANYRRLLSQTFISIGSIQDRLKQLPEALESYGKALALQKDLYEKSQDSQDAAANLATSHRLVAEVHRLMGETPYAREHLEVSRKLRQEIVDRDPSNAKYRLDLERVESELNALPKEGQAP